MDILKIINELKQIAENENNEDKAKNLIKACLKESKRKYISESGELEDY